MSNSRTENILPERKELFRNVRRVVAKLGTRVVTVDDNALNTELIDRLAEDVAQLHSEKVQVAVVSSGAVGAGMGRLGIRHKPQRIQELQATAAIGQSLLMNAYKVAFLKHNIPVGQVLLTSEDLDNRRRYVNAQNTLDTLFRFEAVPIINENDSVAVEEIQLSVGDNDRLSSMVAHLVNADLLITFTDVDGLYSGDPARNPEAELIPRVQEVSSEVMALAGKPGSSVSLGGMRTKLEAAASVTRGGRMMVIANGLTSSLSEILSGAPVGTLFMAQERKMSNRQLWMADSRRQGIVVVDEGAVQAIGERGKSLLPSGIIEVLGDFDAGELVAVEDPERREIARGLVRYGSRDIRKIQGKQTSEAASILDLSVGEEVVHRDDLVVI